MTLNMETSFDHSQLDLLCAQIENAWEEREDGSVVDQLAAQYPAYARSLYDFFALLIGVDLEARHQKTVEQAPNVRSLLEYLTQRTGEKPTAIAAKMDVPYPFLLQAQRHPNVIPFRARTEIVKRAAHAWNVDETQAMSALENPQLDAIAASRNNPYSAEAPDFATIIKNAKMDKKDREFWLSLQ
jgi:hypothetical protein